VKCALDCDREALATKLCRVHYEQFGDIPAPRIFKSDSLRLPNLTSGQMRNLAALVRNLPGKGSNK